MKSLISLLILLLISDSGIRQPQSREENVTIQDAWILSVLWYQRSAELQALYHQAYNIAARSLVENLKNSNGQRPKAVIMDIDETILDNSPTQALQIIRNVSYSDSLWQTWVDLAEAKPCPGALEFTRLADSLKIEIFYITNRDKQTAEALTILNLRKYGFPFADTLHLYAREQVSSKSERRKKVSETHDVLLLIGDNLADFDDSFDSRGADLGFGSVENMRKEFGTRFVILPNPMYGPWINTAIRYGRGRTLLERFHSVLVSFAD